MTKFTLPALAAATLLAGTTAHAGELTYSYATLGISNYSSAIEDYTAYFAMISGEYQAGRLLTFGTITATGGDGSDFQVIEIGAGFQFSPSFLAGASVSYEDDTGFGSDTSYSVFAEFSPGPTDSGVGLAYFNYGGDSASLVLYGQYAVGSATELSFLVSHDLDDSDTFYSVLAEYEANRLTYTGAFSGDSDNFNSLAFQVEFRPGERSKIFGLAGFAWGDGDDLTVLGLGGGFKLSEALWLEGSASRTSGGGSDGTTISLNLTYEVGKSGRLLKRVENSYLDLAGGSFGAF